MIPVLILLASVEETTLDPPPYASVLGRVLSWDPKGVYPLDVDEPLTPAGAQIVRNLLDAERGKAELLARYRLKMDGNDLVPAWALAQIVRVKRGALREYQETVAGKADAPASWSQRLYRFHLCRLAVGELPIERCHTGDDLFDAIKRDQKILRDVCRPQATKRLGFLIALTQTTPYWVLHDRALLEEFRQTHPNGPDIRVALAQVYTSGLHLGPISTYLTPEATAPEEPQPRKTLEMAQSILKDRPDNPLGHYYAGVAQFMLKRTDLALAEFKAALATGKLPPFHEEAARNFLARPGFPALRPKVNY